MTPDTLKILIYLKNTDGWVKSPELEREFFKDMESPGSCVRECISWLACNFFPVASSRLGYCYDLDGVYLRASAEDCRRRAARLLHRAAILDKTDLKLQADKLTVGTQLELSVTECG